MEVFKGFLREKHCSELHEKNFTIALKNYTAKRIPIDFGNGEPMELLDAILVVTGCKNAEQLKDLSADRKMNLARALEERVPHGLASIEEWNELLFIFMEVPPETDKKIAKKKLICFLCGEEYVEEQQPPSEKSKWWKFRDTH